MKRIIVLLLFSVTAFGQIPNIITPSQKLFGLSKFWQEVNYNFVYLDRVDRQEWDKKYIELLETIPKTNNDYEYYRELQKFCAMLKDGHTNIYIPESIFQMNTMFGDYRMFIKNIENKAIVVRTNLSKKEEIPPGSEIIEVNGLPVREHLERNVKPYISSSTDYVLQDIATSQMLQGLEGDTFNIKLKKPDGTIASFTLTHKTTEEEAVYPDWEKPLQLLDFKWLENGIAYLGLNSFEDPKIDSLFIAKLPELYKAKGLIVDLRYNGGGKSGIGAEILQYLTKDKYLYGARQNTRMHVPTYKAWGTFLEPKDTIGDALSKQCYHSYRDNYYFDLPYKGRKITIKNKRIVVPTAILVSHGTASAAEDFLICADNQKHMVKIGQNSFGSTGQPMMFNMPGGGNARICTKKDTYPDGREFVGVGVKPDIYVETTLEDYLNKKDPVLEKAVEYLTAKIM